MMNSNQIMTNKHRNKQIQFVFSARLFASTWSYAKRESSACLDAGHSLFVSPRGHPCGVCNNES